MKKVFYLTLLLLTSLITSTFAQNGGTLSGTILDENNEGLGFVNVAVVNPATAAIVTGAIAEMDGSFRIKTPAKGTYLLKVSGLGYTPLQTEAFEVTGPDFSKDFGKLQLKPDVKTLKEVTVQAMRPTISLEADKMVVSVEGTALSAGSTAYEVLEKSPGVWVDQDGNITLNGKPGVMVMINGKQSYLSGKELQNLLQGMSAENLKDLEIITNPSAKYDAEGTSGIININLKKNNQVGMSGSVYGGYQYNKLSTYTSGAELSHKSGKWNTTASFDLARRMRYRNMDMERVFSGGIEEVTMLQEGYEESERWNPSLRLGTDYDLNEQHSVGFLANLMYSDNSNLFRTDSYLRRPNPADNLNINSLNRIQDTYKNGTFNLHYAGKLDSVGTTLSADLDYVRILDNSDLTFENQKFFQQSGELFEQELLTSDNPATYDIYSAKVDFGKTLGKTKMELGAKASHVVSDNALDFYEVVDARETLDPNRTSHFIFKENIYAAYATFSTSFGKVWQVKGGLRAEQTDSKGNSITLNRLTERHYLDLFPSLFVQQQVSENYQIGYKYSRRINRPYYENLNPFIFYIDPYTWATGNPYLKPQYTDSYELTQTLKKNYNLVMTYAVTKNFIAEIPVFNSADNTTVFERQNVKSYRNIGATMVAPVRISGKWDMNNTATLAHQRYTNVINNQSLLREQLFFMAQSNHNIQLPHDVRLELNAGYQGPAVYGMFEIDDMWWLDAGLKRSFLNDKLDLSLNVTDIFKTRNLDLTTRQEGNLNRIIQYHGSQSVRINLRYRFNKGKEFETKKRNVSLDELNRTGN
ncbi:outer membrane beta-barrel family protein [Pontibacter roseus]|uniref:outer membrane beta-barrel family protein n=1 Tax=Pontibacter roseus TaxID=336989 RepID=UPI000365298E|nr:outer membrane beta-barrel family protein [Pontibacter roseus]